MCEHFCALFFFFWFWSFLENIFFLGNLWSILGVYEQLKDFYVFECYEFLWVFISFSKYAVSVFIIFNYFRTIPLRLGQRSFDKKLIVEHFSGAETFPSGIINWISVENSCFTFSGYFWIFC